MSWVITSPWLILTNDGDPAEAKQKHMLEEESNDSVLTPERLLVPLRNRCPSKWH